MSQRFRCGIRRGIGGGKLGARGIGEDGIGLVAPGRQHAVPGVEAAGHLQQGLRTRRAGIETRREGYNAVGKIENVLVSAQQGESVGAYPPHRAVRHVEGREA